MELLESLRDQLRAEGYFQTFLVRNLSDGPEFRSDNFLKSIFALEKSNVNFFVLNFDGFSQGATRELSYILSHPEHVFKSTVYVESEFDLDGNLIRKAMTTLLLDDIRTLNFRVREFRREDSLNLFKLMKGVAAELFYYYLKNRPMDLSSTNWFEKR